MKDRWKLKKVEIIPLIIRANGLVHLRELDLPPNIITWMQKAVSLESIIRKIIYPYSHTTVDTVGANVRVTRSR